MAPNLPLLASFLLILTFSTTTTALDILKQLKDYNSDYGAFIDVLNKSKLYEKINTRNTVTVLILSNSTMSKIADRDDDEKANIISTHILLDYFDKLKLGKIKSILVTNLYQSSGVAADEQGFVNVTHLPSGSTGFGSAVKGSPLVAKLVKEVFTKPYNLSVLEVSLPIVSPGIGKEILPPPPPPASASGPSSKKSKGKDDDEGETVVDDDDASSPSDSPAESPESGSPAPSPSKADAPDSSDKDDIDDPVDDDDDQKSSGSRLFVGGVMLIGLLGNLL